MEFKYSIFKFKRGGLFGTGNNVKVCYKGEVIDEFDIDDYDSGFDDKKLEFECACRDWYCEYGIDLRRSLED